MEVKLKDRLVGKGLSGFVKNVEAVYKRMSRVLVKASGVDVASFGSYEVSREYRAHLAKAECEKSRTLEELRKGLLARC